MAEKNFHVLVGTKGQLIKIAPIVLEMDRRGIEYNFVNASQHTKILDEISGLFELKNPDFVLESVGKDITNVREIVWWGSKNIWKYGLSKTHKTFKTNKNDVLIVHGDAPPALLGLILGKSSKLKIAHVESGERTHNKFEPFPEEIIRVIVDRFSNYLFACSDEAYQNLMNEGVRGRIYNVKINTVFDALRTALNSKKGLSPPNEEYALVSIHRFETISSKSRMKLIVKVVNEIAECVKVIFPLHESTKNKLNSFQLIDTLNKNANIEVMPLLDYFSFIKFIKNSSYVITDGGGPQQETYYLGVPCLLLREYTERLGYSNVFVAGFDKGKINYFIKNYNDYKINGLLKELKDYSPSKEIVRILVDEYEGE